MERELKQIIRQKITDALAASVPAHTPRDVHLPGIKGKAMAVIGMRRSGKTTFLWQCLGERLEAGTPRDALLYFNFEDERLADMNAQELQLVVEVYFSLHPERRDSKSVTFFLDEIQEVPGWETFVRRLLDTEKVELFLSGSSARLLSREVATSMRGRAMEVLVHPFSLREALRHRGAEPKSPWTDLPKAARSTLDKHISDALSLGRGISRIPRCSRAGSCQLAAHLRGRGHTTGRDRTTRSVQSGRTALAATSLARKPCGASSVCKSFSMLLQI